MKKFKILFVYALSFFLGLYICRIGTLGSGDAYLDRLDAIYNAIIYTASGIFTAVYIFIRKSD